MGNPSDTEGLIKQQQHQRQRKRQLKINISEMVTILLILLLPRTFIADRARCKWVGRSAVEVNRKLGNLRSYDGNCYENVTLKLNFALS